MSGGTYQLNQAAVGRCAAVVRTARRDVAAGDVRAAVWLEVYVQPAVDRRQALARGWGTWCQAGAPSRPASDAVV